MWDYGNEKPPFEEKTEEGLFFLKYCDRYAFLPLGAL
jgi:hypothetical protein